MTYLKRRGRKKSARSFGNDKMLKNIRVLKGIGQITLPHLCVLVTMIPRLADEVTRGGPTLKIAEDGDEIHHPANQRDLPSV